MTDLKNLTLGRRIQALRKAQSLTQEQLAERMDVTPQAVSKWENDQSCPDIMSLPRLAKELQATVDALLTGETAESAAPVPAKAPEELIVRMTFSDTDGMRLGVNLPFTVFRMLARHNMISITYHAESGEQDMNVLISRLCEMDFNTIVRMIESGVSGKLVDVDADGEHLTIWTE